MDTNAPFVDDAPLARVAPVALRASMRRWLAVEHRRVARDLDEQAHDKRRIARRQTDAWFRAAFARETGRLWARRDRHLARAAGWVS